jgi:MoxR-like ATPase
MDTAILRELSRLPGPVLCRVYKSVAGQDTSDKLAAMGGLGRAIADGRVTLAQVQAMAAGTAPLTSAAAPVNPSDDTARQAAAATAARAESVALEARSAIDALAPRLEVIEGAILEQVRAVESLKASVESPEMQSTIAAAVAAAVAPIAAAAEVNGTQAQVLAAAAAPVDRLPASAVFGVEVLTPQGQPVMIDIWGHPAAPPIDPLHIWTEDTVRLLALGQDMPANIWLGGEKGTGKTKTAEQWAARTGRPFTRVNFHRFSTAEEFIGATGLTGGSTEFQPGPVLSSYCTVPGALLLLDEPSNADPGELALLNGLLEPAGRVTIGGRTWTAAAGAMCIAADNTLGTGDASGRYVGTRQQNVALLDRFALMVAVSFLPEEQEVAAIIAHTKCSVAAATEVRRIIAACRSKVGSGDLIDAPSLRRAIAWIRSMPALGVRRAWDITIASSQPVESAVALEAIYAAEVSESHLDRTIVYR